MPAHRKVSLEQIKLLVELLETHPELGLCRAPNGLVETHRRWQIMAKSLNGIPGVVKTGREWRSYWSEFKYVIKKKARKSLSMLGGKLTLLTSLEKKALNVIGCVDGLQENSFTDMPPIEINALSMPSEVKAEFPETVAIINEVPQTSRARADSSRSAPSTEENSLDSDSEIRPDTKNNKKTAQDDLPRWLYELESRRVAAEERMAEALEKLADTVDIRLGALEQTLLRICPDNKNS